MSTTSLKEFWDQLNNHDWYYQYSDDNSVWRRGQAAREGLQRAAKTSPEHQKMYDGFFSHVFNHSGEEKPKPERPE